MENITEISIFVDKFSPLAPFSIHTVIGKTVTGKTVIGKTVISEQVISE